MGDIMKLKNKKHIILKPILVLIFMFFVCYKTVNFLSNNVTISNEEYVRLLLSDLYKEKDNNFYYNIVKIFSKNFQPENLLDIPENDEEYNHYKLEVKSKYVSNPNVITIKEPILYIYNTHQLENYSKDETDIYKVTPNVMMTSYILSDKLNSIGINNIVEDTNIRDFMDSNNIDDYYNSSRLLLNKIKKEHKSIKYYIDIHRSNREKNITTVNIEGKKYARLLFVINEETPNYKENLYLAQKINTRLNEIYPGITRGIEKVNDKEKMYNQDFDKNMIFLEFGGIENNIDEVINTIDAFIEIFRYIEGE